MWHREGWYKRKSHEVGCWTDFGGSRRFFDDVFRKTQCNINWYDGALPGNQRPRFSSRAPALLGFDETIAQFCHEKLARPLAGWPHCPPCDRDIAESCVKANQNVLRLLNPLRGHKWNMCQNLQWMTCAVQGALPGQQGNTMMHFATAPKTLRIEEWGSQNGFKGWNSYRIKDVFYAEVCILSQICRNGAQLFQIERGEAFYCDLDRRRVDEMRDFLAP